MQRNTLIEIAMLLSLFLVESCGSNETPLPLDGATQKITQAKDGEEGGPVTPTTICNAGLEYVKGTCVKKATPDGGPFSDGPSVTPDGPLVTPDGPLVTPDGPLVTPDGPLVTPDGPLVTPDGP